MKQIISAVLLLAICGGLMAQAPGGVPSGLVVWLKANQGTDGLNDGDLLSIWGDHSGLGNNATQPVAAAKPIFLKTALNGNAAVQFNGGARFFNINLLGISNSQYTILSVIRRGAAASNQYFLGVQQSSPTGLHMGYRLNNSLRLFDNTVSANAAVANFSAGNETPAIVISSYSNTVGRTVTEVKNGASSFGWNANTGAMVFTGNGAIGRGFNANGFNGLVAEVIVYNRVLTTAELKNIQTYLSVKYGTTIPLASHHYFTDPGFANDLVALGRDMANQGLLQESGKSENTDNMLEVDTPSDLNDGEYWVAGNDNGAQAFSPHTGGNCALTNSFGRVWKVFETGETGTMTLRFEVDSYSSDPESVVLLVDRDNDGFNDENPIEGVYSSPFMEFANININHNERFTLAEGVANWYAVADGNASGPIWAKNPAGTPQTVPSWCSRVDVTILAGRSVTASSSITCKNFNIEGGATFTRNSGNLTVRESFTVNGTFNSGNGTVYLNGTTQQQIGGTSIIAFNNLQVNNPAGVIVTATRVQMKRQLQMNSGTFVTSNKLELLSTASAQGSIGPLISGDISGNVTINRYRAGTTGGWVNLSSPAQGKTIHDWNDDLITSGFPGSDFPSYGMNNIQWYNEAAPGTKNQGFVGATNLSNTIGNNRGFFAYMNGGIMSLDVNGQIFKGLVSLPVSYTNTGNPSGDGWSLVGNPYPSAIDWDAVGWTKTNLDNAVYVWDAESGQYASYVNGVGNNGGSRFIPSSQSFFVMTNAASPVLEVNESVKSSNQGVFKNYDPQPGVFMLTLTNGKQKDQTTITCDYSSSARFDSHSDAYKLSPPFAVAPFLATTDEDGLEYSINSIGKFDQIIVPLIMHGGSAGEFELNWSSLPMWTEGLEVVLENTLTGQTIPMNKVNSIKLFLSGEDEPEIRWQIKIGHVSEDGSLADTLPVTGRINDGQITLLFALSQPEELEIRVWNMIGQMISEPIRGTFQQDQLAIAAQSQGSPCLVEIRSIATQERTVLKIAP